MTKIKVTRRELEQLTKYKLFRWYTTHINDDIGPVMFAGMTIVQWLDSIFQGEAEVEIKSLTT